MKTKMKMKALQGAATLQVAMVTSTDWSSNGNFHFGGCHSQPQEWVRWGSRPRWSTLSSGILGGKPKVKQVFLRARRMKRKQLGCQSIA